MHDDGDVNGGFWASIGSVFRTFWFLYVVVCICLLPYYFFWKVSGATKKLPLSTCEQEKNFWQMYRWTHGILMYGSIALLLWFLQCFIFDMSNESLMFWLAASTNWFGTLHAVFVSPEWFDKYDYLNLVQTNWMYVIGIAAIGFVRYRALGKCNHNFSWIPNGAELQRRRQRYNDVEKPYQELTKVLIQVENSKPSFDPQFSKLPEAEQQRRMQEWQDRVDQIKAQLASMPRIAV